MSKLTEQVSEIARPAAAQFGCEVYDVSYQKEGTDYCLTVYIYKEAGVSIDDCANVSEILSGLLDEHDFISGAYNLIVSSPGVEREIKNTRHFELSLGKDINVKLYKALESTQSKKISGTLTGYGGDSFTVETENGESVVIGRDTVSQIKLLYK